MPKRSVLLLVLISSLSAVARGQVPASAESLRVDPATQRQRDDVRVTILQDELAAEANAWADAQRDLRARQGEGNPAAVRELVDQVARHRRNISSLAAELVSTERQLARGPARSTPPTSDSATRPQRSQERKGVDEAQRAAPASAPDWFIPATRTAP